MKVIYIWKNNKWEVGSKETEHWIGNPDVKSIFTDIESIRTIYGSFAAVWETTEAVYMLVDLIGSYPLFYCLFSNTLYISDDAALIARNTGKGLDKDDTMEFLSTGYVTERETLFNDVYTLNPGTWIQIEKESGKIVEKEWFEFKYRHASKKELNDSIKEFDGCLFEVFSDLIHRLDGRTALIPLSGGLDSRLVVAYLKKLGYENTVSFSYGKEGNWEAEKSRQITNHLEYRWIFEEYDSERWKRLMHSDDYWQFLDWSCRGRSIGCVQALPAILDIKKKKLIAEDAIVIPGHALDFSLGSHITEAILNSKGKQIEEHIITNHYNLVKANVDYISACKWNNDIDNEDPVNAYMKWEYRNRQSKFIANDVRTYEFAGYSYELPLWDIRIQEFAMGLPLEELLNRRFQYEFTKEIVDPMVGITEEEAPTKGAELEKIKSIIKKSILVKKYLEYKAAKDRRYNDTNGFLSWLTDEEYSKYSSEYGKQFNINSIVANDYISKLRKGL